MVYSDPIPAIPERVMVKENRTICFWPDGTKQVATCDKGDDQSAYVGILVAFARRYMPRAKDEDGKRLSFGETMDSLLGQVSENSVQQIPRKKLETMAWEAIHRMPGFEERSPLERLFAALWAAVYCRNEFDADLALSNLDRCIDAYIKSAEGSE